MVHKQVLWRRSNQALFLFSFLLVPTHLFSADLGASGGVAAAAGSASGDLSRAQATLDEMIAMLQETLDTIHPDDRKRYQNADSGAEERDYSGSDSDSGDSYSELLGDDSDPCAVGRDDGADCAESATDGKKDKKGGKAEEDDASAGVDRSKPWHEQPDSFLASTMFHGCSMLDIKQVYETAPSKVKGCVAHLRNPKHYGPAGAPDYRTLFLHGESGSGKSTIARAIALYAGWDAVCTTPASFQVGNRGDAAVKLRQQVDEILDSKAPTVFIIDEANGLLENAESKNHDNDATSKEFWDIMDRVSGRDDFFMVCTANRLFKVPPQVKTRIKSRMCKITMPKDPALRLRIFKSILSRYKLSLNAASEKNMVAILAKNEKWSGRDFADFVFTMRQIASDDLNIKDFQGEVDPKVIGLADKAIAEDEEDLLYYHQELTDEERQDLYQVQNMYLQLGIQRLQKHAWAGLRTPGLKSSDAKHLTESIFTANQKRLAKDHLDVKAIDEQRFI